MSELGEQDVIAHNEASPAREKVLRLFEQRHERLNITMALPSLDGIKRAVEMNLGVALLPRRCAVTELARGTLVATTVPQLRLARHLRLIYRQAGELSHAAQQFLAVARKHEQAEHPAGSRPSCRRRGRRRGVGPLRGGRDWWTAAVLANGTAAPCMPPDR